jgi:hypothetical protein
VALSVSKKNDFSFGRCSPTGSIAVAERLSLLWTFSLGLDESTGSLHQRRSCWQAARASTHSNLARHAGFPPCPTMSEETKMREMLAEWMRAMRKRDQLLDLSERLRVVQDEAGIQFSTYDEVCGELDRANAELERLQALLTNWGLSGT